MIDANPQIVGAVVSLAVGLYSVARRYRLTGQLKLSSLPWRAFRRLAYTLRRMFFTVPKPDTETIAVDKSIQQLEDQLGHYSYNPKWPLSYRYMGEDYNARMYYKDVGKKNPHRQVHVRAWEQPDGSSVLYAHEEPAPEHHPKAHLREKDMQNANQWIVDTLQGGRRQH